MMLRHDSAVCKDPVRVAILCSSAGGVLRALGDIERPGKWPFELVGVLTDRPCGAEQVAELHNIPCRRINANSMCDWSTLPADALSEWSPDVVLLLIMRMIGPQIWNNPAYSVWNLHPSLLPAHRGRFALERNFSDAVAARGESVSMGASIHLVNGELDAGPIISQRSFTLEDAPTLSHAHHLCFLCKIALTLECICKFNDGSLPSLRGTDTSCDWPEHYTMWTPHEPLADVLARFAQPWAAQWLRRIEINAAEVAAQVTGQ